MRIFVAIYEDDAHQAENPFAWTLEDAIQEHHKGIEFVSRKDEFWTDDKWDIVHVMWPDIFAPYMQEGKNLLERLRVLKNNGTKIIAHIHNLTTHTKNEVMRDAYDIVYEEADIMIHLGTYSLNILKDKYPSKMHVLIPHHIYDTIYSQKMPSKPEALHYFGLKKCVYAISFGRVRNAREKDLIFRAVKSCPNIKFVVPRFIDIPHGKINKRWIKQRLKWLYYRIKYPNLIINGNEYVTNEELPIYYALADISFIQRIDTLNSGNVPLGMFFGKVIVGPEVGNVGRVIEETGNFSFDPNDTESVRKALVAANEAVKHDKGEENREYATRNWSTKHIAEKLWDVYEQIINE